jgi:uncharacterized protein YcbK (DUF882 family)
MRHAVGWVSTISLLWAVAAWPAGASPAQGPLHRFFFSGDGRIDLVSEKNGSGFSGRYRTPGGEYDPGALEAIHKVFGAPYSPERPAVSLRLIEYLDYLEDRHRPGARITITSGYRSPEYNRSIRNKGALAAKASLHQYGMAADLVMDGVPSKTVWETVKALSFGGGGYYHGRTVHIDVGPARSWDETTSGVGTDISDDNKLIGIVSDFDVYRPGEEIRLRFIRMTAFPVGVSPVLFLERAEGGQEAPAAFEPAFGHSAAERCIAFEDIEQMSDIRWRLPQGLGPGRYRVRARFCDNPWEKMPGEVSTPVFEVAGP